MKRLLKIFAWLMALFLISSIGAVLYYKWAPVRITPTMLMKNRAGSWEHEWVPLSEISSSLPLAVIASEDQNFLKHNGFDFKEIKNAYEEAQAGGRQRGASTISQQTAKNVFLWQGHSWVRKGLEAYFTVLIEWMWGKERIMEVYLNSIEMGPGIYGAQAAAGYSFDIPATELSRSQSALIAATLPNPIRYSSKHPGPYMKKRQRWILRQMRNLNDIRWP